MPQNGQAPFKDLAAFAVRYVSDHFETLCIKGLNIENKIFTLKELTKPNYMFKVDNTRTRCKICSRLTIKTLE